MANGDLRYVILIPSDRGPLLSSPNPMNQRMKTVNARVELFSMASMWLHNQSIKKQINGWLYAPETQKRISAAMPARGGVLVVLVMYQRPTEIGQIRQFHAGFVHSGGTNPEKILARYMGEDKLYATPPKSWQRKEQYIWVTNQWSFSRPLAPQSVCTPDNPLGD